MMTTTGTEDKLRIRARPVRRSPLQEILLACGVLSSLLYAATDVLGGLGYPGYSFTSQAISELMASGAPSEAIVDPLFILYGVFVIAFAVAVYWAGVRGSRALRVAGALLAVYAALGFTGPTLFEMSRRGTGSLADDTPHIILTAVLVLVTLSAIGIGAFALGRRFRVYSLATLVTTVAFGALSAPYGARLAAGEPTPGFGIIERILVYSTLLWVAVLAIALQRRLASRRVSFARSTAGANGHGRVAPAFEEPRADRRTIAASRTNFGPIVR